MFLSAECAFYLASQIMSLGEINEDTYHSFANGFFRKQGREMSAETFHHLYDLVDGQTWYVQEILHQLYEDSEQPLTVQSTNAAVDGFLRKWDISFSNQYQSLTDNQAKLLKAVAKKGVVPAPLAQDFIAAYRLPAISSTRMALKTLEKRQMLYRSKVGYIVYDRFFGMWLRRQ